MIQIPEGFEYLDINEQWEKALESVYSGGYNTLLIGRAGTGKSQFIHLMKKLDEIHNVSSIYVAPTGISAVNIEGATVHSTFKLGIEMRDPSCVRVSHDTRELLSIVDKIVIDECSMLRADIFDIMESMCRQSKEDENFFGNTQVIIIADLYQLSPVIGRTKEEKDFFSNMYGSNSYFFGSDSYISNEDTFNKIEFKHIYRQDDSEFKDVLNRIRVGCQTDGDLEYINSRRTLFTKYKKEFLDWIYITPFNETVATINSEALARIESKELVFRANVSGNINPKNFLVPLEIKVKEGCKVMMLINDPNKKFQNGTQGTFLRMQSSDTMLIQINEVQVEVIRHDFAEYKYVRKGKTLIQQRKGGFKQFPLKLCYAITAHKSQSSTFHEGYIDFGRSLKFTPHLAYVMLSRFSDVQRIGLKRSLRHEDICINGLVTEFMESFVEDYIPAPRNSPVGITVQNNVVEDDLPF